jgi:hypothetical protein
VSLISETARASETVSERRKTVRIDSDRCAKIKNLGFRAPMHIRMYGERFEIVSDPFDEGDCIAVRATSGSDPQIRMVRLPQAILVGPADRFLKRPGVDRPIKLVVGTLHGAQ